MSASASALELGVCGVSASSVNSEFAPWTHSQPLTSESESASGATAATCAEDSVSLTTEGQDHSFAQVYLTQSYAKTCLIVEYTILRKLVTKFECYYLACIFGMITFLCLYRIQPFDALISLRIVLLLLYAAVVVCSCDALSQPSRTCTQKRVNLVWLQVMCWAVFWNGNESTEQEICQLVCTNTLSFKFSSLLSVPLSDFKCEKRPRQVSQTCKAAL